MAGGRPTKYTEDLGDKICEGIAQGISLAKQCQAEGMPEVRSVYRWRREHEEFCQNYNRAREDQADFMVEEMLSIADNADPSEAQLARLQVDTRKWAASKFKPKNYGDKITQEHTGADGGAVKNEWTVTIVEPGK